MNQKRKTGRKRRDEYEEQRDDQWTSDQLDLEESEDNPLMQRILKHPIAIGVMIAAGAFVVIHASSYLLDAGSKMARSYRKFRQSLRPFPQQ